MADNSQSEALILYAMSVPTASEALFYFHAVNFMIEEVGKKKLNIVRNVVSSIVIGMATQLVQKQ